VLVATFTCNLSFRFFVLLIEVKRINLLESFFCIYYKYSKLIFFINLLVLMRVRTKQSCCGHSLLLSSYLLCRIKWKENSCCAFEQHLQDQTHLDCPASEPFQRVIFGTTSVFYLWFRPWGVTRLLGLRGIPPRLYLSEGVG